MLDKFCMLLLSLIFVLSVTTELRFMGTVGVAEICALIYMSVRFIFVSKFGLVFNKYLLVFIYLFFAFIFIGTILSIANSRDVFFRDVFAYLYCFVVLIFLFQNVLSSGSKTLFFVKSFFFTSMLYLLFIDVCAYFYPPFMYEGFRLAGLSSNPNQLALLVLVTFNMLFLFSKDLCFSGSVRTLSYVFLIYVSLRTVSEALLVAIFLGCFMYAVCRIYAFSLRRPSSLYVFMISIIVLNVFVVYFAKFVTYTPSDAYEAININNQGDDRFTLWFNGLLSLKDSFLFGNGPGAHSGFDAPFEGVEAHNTFIDMISQVGFLGFISFSVLTLYIFLRTPRRLRKYAVFSLSSLFAFSLFHFVLRQPLFWLALILPLFVFYLNRGKSILR